MEQSVTFGRPLSQIGLSRAHTKEGLKKKLNEQRRLERYSKIPKHSEFCAEPEEIEGCLQIAELHSRSQSLSSTEIFHLQSLNALLSIGNAQHAKCQKYRTTHTSCMSLDTVAEWLKAKLVNIVQKRYTRKREKLRLKTAQMHAALSVAKLAAVVAGITRNWPFQSNNLGDIAMTDRGEDTAANLHAALTAAAAVMAASCTETAKSAGASREHVLSVISMGLETRRLEDVLTLTISAAACLKAAEGLKGRTISNSDLEEHMNSRKGAILLVRTPEGRLHTRMVSVHCEYDNIILTLGKKHHFTTSKKYIIFHEQDEEDAFSNPTDEHSYQAMNLSTSGGTIQLLFQEREQYRSWKSLINYLVTSKGCKLSY